MPNYIATVYVHGQDHEGQPEMRRHVVTHAARDESEYRSRVRVQLAGKGLYVEFGPVGLSKIQFENES